MFDYISKIMYITHYVLCNINYILKMICITHDVFCMLSKI